MPKTPWWTATTNTAMPKGTQSWYSETTPIITKKMKCDSVTPAHRWTREMEAAMRLVVVAAAWPLRPSCGIRARTSGPATAARTVTAAGCP